MSIVSDPLGRRQLLAGSIALLGAAQCRAATLWTPPNGIRGRIESAFGNGGVARARLDAMADEDKLSGVVAVALGDEILFQQAYGMADRARGVANRIDTRFNLASMGKMFTAVAVARLVESGRLGWNDRVTGRVPGLPDAFAAITVDHLLTHRSGLGSYFGSPLYASKVARTGRSVADYMEIVTQERPRFAPGTQFEYSNSGYVLLGALIERVTGADYFRAVDDLVYRPAGMGRTAHLTLDRLGPDAARGYSNGCFGRPPSVCTAQPAAEVSGAGLRGTPAGGVYSTAGDLVRFAHAFRSDRLVSAQTRALMTRRHVDIARPGGPLDGYGYGFGLLRVGAIETHGHNGGTPGATAQMDMLDDPPLTTIILANLDSAQRPVSALLRSALIDV